MPRARKSVISLEDTPYYHCISRCVRRAFLWGADHFSGKDYSHRKQWVVDRLALLTQIFAIEVCAYAVMSNHYHVVLYVDQQRAQAWAEDEVIEHWQRLFSLPVLALRYLNKESLSQSEHDRVREYITLWRQRLHDISWFMRCLNEYLARAANKEDNCTGRFWEGRFKSQALLDEAGLLTCMAYVDLNPIRAGIAKKPEDSDYTSIQKRIYALQQKRSTPRMLKAFQRPHKQEEMLPFLLQDYLELVDWSGRAIRDDKRGVIDEQLPNILIRLNINTDTWRRMMQPKGNLFKQAIGCIDSLRIYAHNQCQRWCWGMAVSAMLYCGN